MGLAFGLLLSACSTLLRLFAGTEAFDANGTTYVRTVATYLIGPTAGGIVVALLFPLRQWRLGAMFVGFVAAIPIYAGAFMVAGVHEPAGILVCALATAVPLGICEVGKSRFCFPDDAGCSRTIVDDWECGSPAIQQREREPVLMGG